jgi:hypothetical protein
LSRRVAVATLSEQVVPVGPDPGSPTGTRWSWLSGRRATALCLLVYAALAVLAFAPVSPLSTGALPTAGNGNPAGSDAFQMSWFLAFTPYAITHGSSLFHTNLIVYPAGVNLADNTTVPVLGVLGWPITATLGPVATFNFLIRLSFFVSSVSMFFVLGRWCSTWQARFVGGLLYGFGPYMTGQALHLDLVFVPIPPLLVLLGDELLVRRRVRAPLLGLLIGLAAGVQYLISPDVLSGCAVMAVIVGAGLAVRHRDQVVALLGYLATAAAAAAAVFVVIAGAPIYEMLTGQGHLTGPVTAVTALQGDSADLLGPIAPTSTQLLTPPFLSHLGDNLVSSNLSESDSYLGFPLLAVLVVIVRKLRSDATVRLFAGAAVASWVMSLGGHLVIADQRTPLPLPGDLPAHLPLLQDTIPARYALYVILCLAVVLAIGIERLWLAPARPAASGPSRRKLAIVGGIVVLSLLPDAPFVSAALPWSPSLPATVKRLVPPGSVVVTDPPTQLGHASAMAWQAVDGMAFRLVGGYANVAVPGKKNGQKGVEAPSFLARMPQQPVGGGPASSVAAIARADGGEEAALRAYLEADTAKALVFTGLGAPTDGEGSIGYDPSRPLPASSYWFLTAALGPPALVAPGFVIWLAGTGGWGDRPAG